MIAAPPLLLSLLLASTSSVPTPALGWVALGGLGVNFVTVVVFAIALGKRDERLANVVKLSAQSADKAAELEVEQATLSKDVERLVEVIGESRESVKALTVEVREDRRVHVEATREFSAAVHRLAIVAERLAASKG